MKSISQAIVIFGSVIALAGPTYAQTSLGSMSIDESDVPAAAAYCNALLAQTGDEDTTTTAEESVAAAPESISLGADGAGTGNTLETQPELPGTGLDLSNITIEQCQEAGLLDQ